MGQLLALPQNDGQPPMSQEPAHWGYTVLRSKDKLLMVQIFTDLSTGLIEYSQVCQRAQSWHSWGPPTELDKC
jgi:hypothetical protein